MIITQRLKILEIILVIVFCLYLFVACENGCGIGLRLYESEYFIYTVSYNSDVVTILGLTDKGQEQEYLVVPEKIDGKEVVALDYDDYNTAKIEKKFGDKKYSGLQSDKLKKIFVIPKVQLYYMGFFEGAENLYGVFYLANDTTVREGINHYNYYYTKGNDVPNGYRYGYFANVSYYCNYEQAPNAGFYWIDNYGYGEKIEFIPDAPIRDGYTFGGWYKESECVNTWNFETDVLPKAQIDDNEQEIYQETTLYAKWIKN